MVNSKAQRKRQNLNHFGLDKQTRRKVEGLKRTHLTEKRTKTCLFTLTLDQNELEGSRTPKMNWISNEKRLNSFLYIYFQTVFMSYMFGKMLEITFSSH